MPVVRAAEVSDYPVIARLFPELKVADPIPGVELFTSQMLPRVVIAAEDDIPAGYAFWRCYGRTAHVGHVVVAPAARGRGLAGLLMEAVRERVRAEGCSRWYLNVKQDNAPALRAYERSGMVIEEDGWALDARWGELEALPRGGHSGRFESRVISPADDASIAERFELDVERIELLRQRPGVVLVASYDGASPVAFGAFDPSLPGVYPTCVAHADLAPLLLDSFRPHARHEHVHITVEGDRALYEALRATGADLRHAFHRMGGAV